MAADPWVFYDKFVDSFSKATIDLDSGTYKVALFLNGYVPNYATDELYSALANEVAQAFGYLTGGIAITQTVTTVAGVMTFDSADPEWTASGGSLVTRRAVLYETVTSKLVAASLLDNTPGDVTVTTGNSLRLVLPATGYFQLAEV